MVPGLPNNLSGKASSNKVSFIEVRGEASARLRLSWEGVGFGFLTVASSTALLFVLGIAPYNVNMVYMLLTLVATVWFGLWSGVLTAVLAFFCFDFFFIPPYFTFIIDAFQGWTAVFLFLGTALFANQVAGRARWNNQQAQARSQEISALYELATAVITTVDRTEMLRKVIHKVVEVLDVVNCTLYLTQAEDSEQPMSSLHSSSLNEIVRVGNYSESSGHPDVSIAQKVFQQGEAAFFAAQMTASAEFASSVENPTLGNAGQVLVSTLTGPVAYLPLASGSQTLGVLVIVGRVCVRQVAFSLEDQRLLRVFANHVVLAVEHARLIEETAQIAALRESDQLKSALLASVSHELRTPLTAINTAISNLQTRDIEWSNEERQEFLTMIEQETERLTRLVSNLLDLTKIEAGALKPNFGWYYLPEIIEEVVERLRNSPLTRFHPITTSFAPDVPLTRLDYLQIDQVLTNLIENAAKYSASGRPIRVQIELKATKEVRRNINGAANSPPTGQVLLVKVIDEGIGIPPNQLEQIFTKFYRVQQSQDGMKVKLPGSGIGLTIAKGIIEAHGGQIWAQNRVYGGTIFNFTLPVVPLSEEASALASQKGSSNQDYE
jgi:two-component system sensor histidine kinase KdpD